MNSILMTTLALTVISAIFALLLTIADRTIGNYGEVQLTINNDKQFTVEGGSSLLSTLIEQNIFLLLVVVKELVDIVKFKFMKVEDLYYLQNYLF